MNEHESAGDQTQTTDKPALREVKFAHTPQFTQILSQAGLTLAVSTYQAGKLAMVGADASAGLTISFHNFIQAMDWRSIGDS